MAYSLFRFGITWQVKKFGRLNLYSFRNIKCLFTVIIYEMLVLKLLLDGYIRSLGTISMYSWSLWYADVKVSYMQYSSSSLKLMRCPFGKSFKNGIIYRHFFDIYAIGWRMPVYEVLIRKVTQNEIRWEVQWRTVVSYEMLLANGIYFLKMKAF